MKVKGNTITVEREVVTTQNVDYTFESKDGPRYAVRFLSLFSNSEPTLLAVFGNHVWAHTFITHPKIRIPMDVIDLQTGEVLYTNGVKP